MESNDVPREPGDEQFYSAVQLSRVTISALQAALNGYAGWLSIALAQFRDEALLGRPVDPDEIARLPESIERERVDRLRDSLSEALSSDNKEESCGSAVFVGLTHGDVRLLKAVLARHIRALRRRQETRRAEGMIPEHMVQMAESELQRLESLFGSGVFANASEASLLAGPKPTVSPSEKAQTHPLEAPEERVEVARAGIPEADPRWGSPRWWRNRGESVLDALISHLVIAVVTTMFLLVAGFFGWRFIAGQGRERSITVASPGSGVRSLPSDSVRAATQQVSSQVKSVEAQRTRAAGSAALGTLSRAEVLLWRSEHPVAVTCGVNAEPGPWNDSLVVETMGAGLTDVEVEPIVFFEARPTAGTKWVDVRYILDGFYGTQLAGDYEGATRRAYGVRGGAANRRLLGVLTDAVVDSLTSSGFTWGYIEPRRVVRVTFKQLGERGEAWFLMSDQNAEMVRVSRARWDEFEHRAEQLRAAGRVLRVVGASESEVAARVAHECAEAVRR